jgi:pyruvate, orthophosphate dikinase
MASDPRQPPMAAATDPPTAPDAAATAVTPTWVYDFADGSKDMRELLGGKGANVAEMTRVLGPHRVPAGFTITTKACVAYMNAAGSFPEGLHEQVADGLARLEDRAGRRLGDPDDPLLVSVRSGARESMPGMLDTILNLGLNDASARGLAERTDNERFAWDSYRRFVQMYGSVAARVPSRRFEDKIRRVKRERGVTEDVELGVEALRKLALAFKRFYAFPEDPQDQLRGAIRAVFDSWMGERAVTYRRIHRIPDDWGTAGNVQQMVFGNKGETSGSGVAFSRDEVTVAPEPSGDFLPNAQGEDVVSGVRTPRDIRELRDWLPAVHGELMAGLRTLAQHYRDMQDVEFTVEEGRLFFLQTRIAKRPAQAAVRFAVDAVAEGRLSREEALLTIDAAGLDALMHPSFAPDQEFSLLTTGVAASPGAAKGQIVFSAEDAVDWAERGHRVVLVRPFTEADDVHGFFAAQGILTAEGGKASHAALVARGMGKPCVAGASAVQVDVDRGELRVGDTVLREGDLISIDGSPGRVSADDVPLSEPEFDRNFHTVLSWADDLRRLGVRANADTPQDARRARELGAEGIGLCRTEHMFTAADRQPKMQAMILAESTADRRRAMGELLPLQREDFEGLFEEMTGLPVTIRLLDPPLHEFLPNATELALEFERARGERPRDARRLERMLERVRDLEETNPMLGTRGARLGIIAPEIYDVQVEAIMAAARAVQERRGEPPRVEIMIPLVAYEQEVQILRERVERVIADSGAEDLRPLIGTMIELPRACFVANRIARVADFFSFGTNDLTQTVLGSLATTSSRASSRSTWRSGSSTAHRSRLSTNPALAGSGASPPGSGAKPGTTSSSACAENTAATPSPSGSSTSPGWITCRARPTECRSRASPPPRPHCALVEGTSTQLTVACQVPVRTASMRVINASCASGSAQVAGHNDARRLSRPSAIASSAAWAEARGVRSAVVRAPVAIDSPRDVGPAPRARS